MRRRNNTKYNRVTHQFKDLPQTYRYFRCKTCGMIAYEYGGRMLISDRNENISSEYWQNHPEFISCEEMCIMDIIK